MLVQFPEPPTQYLATEPGLGEGDIEGEAEGEIETDGDIEGDAEGEREIDGETEGEAEGERETDGDTEGELDGEADTDGETDGEVEGEDEADGEIEEEGETEGEADSITFPYSSNMKEYPVSTHSAVSSLYPELCAYVPTPSHLHIIFLVSSPSKLISTIAYLFPAINDPITLLIGKSYHSPGELVVTDVVSKNADPMSLPDGRLFTVSKIRTIKRVGIPTLHNFNFTLVIT